MVQHRRQWLRPPVKNLVAIPLIFISILSAINKLENSAGIGKMSLTIVG
ncbi:sodium:dicarboxylate symporter, partial [Salmonella enterica subsp. enterica serovar Enteritidis str. 50-5646]